MHTRQHRTVQTARAYDSGPVQQGAATSSTAVSVMFTACITHLRGAVLGADHDANALRAALAEHEARARGHVLGPLDEPAGGSAARQPSVNVCCMWSCGTVGCALSSAHPAEHNWPQPCNADSNRLRMLTGPRTSPREGRATHLKRTHARSPERKRSLSMATTRAACRMISQWITACKGETEMAGNSTTTDLSSCVRYTTSGHTHSLAGNGSKHRCSTAAAPHGPHLVARLYGGGVREDGDVGIELPRGGGLEPLVHQHHALAHLGVAAARDKVRRGTGARGESGQP